MPHTKWLKHRTIMTIIFFFAGIVAITSFIYILSPKTPVLIGFAGQLSGIQMELGIQERNGVQLAIEIHNAAGGIHGREISLLIRDDMGMPDKAKEVDRELIASGVVAIIGHPTTTQSLAGLEVTEPAKVVMLSPTVSSPVLSGKDDWFFRVMPCFTGGAEALAEYIFHKEKISRVAIILDSDNEGYTRTYSNTFRDKFLAIKGTLAAEITFSSKTQPDFAPLLNSLRTSNAEGLLIVTSDVDTAMIAQRARLLGWDVPLFASGWAQTASLLNNGGKAIEGLKIDQSYASTSQAPRFLDFRKRYKERYGILPTFGSVYGYEAALVLIDALRRTNGKAEGLKRELLKTKNFPGLIDNFSIDAFGDVNRPCYLSEIKNGKLISIGKLNVSDTINQ